MKVVENGISDLDVDIIIESQPDTANIQAEQFSDFMDRMKPQMALALYHIVKGGGLGSGGLNFDAKLRRQSIDPDDLIVAHAEAMDLCARALLIAEKMIKDGELEKQLQARYAGWDGKFGREILSGKKSLAQLAAYVEKGDREPQPRSGRQERLEALVNRYL